MKWNEDGNKPLSCLWSSVLLMQVTCSALRSRRCGSPFLPYTSRASHGLPLTPIVHSRRITQADRRLLSVLLSSRIGVGNLTLSADPMLWRSLLSAGAGSGFSSSLTARMPSAPTPRVAGCVAGSSPVACAVSFADEAIQVCSSIAADWILNSTAGFNVSALAFSTFWPGVQWSSLSISAPPFCSTIAACPFANRAGCVPSCAVSSDTSPPFLQPAVRLSSLRADEGASSLFSFGNTTSLPASSAGSRLGLCGRYGAYGPPGKLEAMEERPFAGDGEVAALSSSALEISESLVFATGYESASCALGVDAEFSGLSEGSRGPM